MTRETFYFSVSDSFRLLNTLKCEFFQCNTEKLSICLDFNTDHLIFEMASIFNFYSNFLLLPIKYITPLSLGIKTNQKIRVIAVNKFFNIIYLSRYLIF